MHEERIRLNPTTWRTMLSTNEHRIGNWLATGWKRFGNTLETRWQFATCCQCINNVALCIGNSFQLFVGHALVWAMVCQHVSNASTCWKWAFNALTTFFISCQVLTTVFICHRRRININSFSTYWWRIVNAFQTQNLWSQELSTRWRRIRNPL